MHSPSPGFPSHQQMPGLHDGSVTQGLQTCSPSQAGSSLASLHQLAWSSACTCWRTGGSAALLSASGDGRLHSAMPRECRAHPKACSRRYLWDGAGSPQHGGSTLQCPGSAGRTPRPVAVDISGMELDPLSMVGYIQEWQRAGHHHGHKVSGQEGRAQDPGRKKADMQRVGRGQVLQSMRAPVRGWAMRICCVGRRGKAVLLATCFLECKGSRLARSERVLTWQPRSSAWAFQLCGSKGKAAWQSRAEEPRCNANMESVAAWAQHHASQMRAQRVGSPCS